MRTGSRYSSRVAALIVTGAALHRDVVTLTKRVHRWHAQLRELCSASVKGLPQGISEDPVVVARHEVQDLLDSMSISAQTLLARFTVLSEDLEWDYAVPNKAKRSVLSRLMREGQL